MATFEVCRGCDGKKTWFSPMRGDIECDWCNGKGKCCNCNTTGARPGEECFMCGYNVALDRDYGEPDDTLEFYFQDGEYGFKVKK